MAVTASVMMQMNDNAHRMLVVGLGKTGLSVARYLSRQGVEVAVVDSREQPPGLAELRDSLPADVALFLGGFDEAAFARAGQLVVSPGVSVQEPPIAAAAARGVPVLGDIELFAREATAPVIAITGSNGKSTVTMLVSAMAQRAGREVRTGGNIGTPIRPVVVDLRPGGILVLKSTYAPAAGQQSGQSGGQPRLGRAGPRRTRVRPGPRRPAARGRTAARGSDDPPSRRPGGRHRPLRRQRRKDDRGGARGARRSTGGRRRLRPRGT